MFRLGRKPRRIDILTGISAKGEHEIDTEIVRASWERLGRRDFDAPSRFAAYLHSLRWNCVTATNPRLFQSPWRAGIKVMADRHHEGVRAARAPSGPRSLGLPRASAACALRRRA